MAWDFSKRTPNNYSKKATKVAEKLIKDHKGVIDLIKQHQSKSKSVVAPYLANEVVQMLYEAQSKIDRAIGDGAKRADVGFKEKSERYTALNETAFALKRELALEGVNTGMMNRRDYKKQVDEAINSFSSLSDNVVAGRIKNISKNLANMKNPVESSDTTMKSVLSKAMKGGVEDKVSKLKEKSRVSGDKALWREINKIIKEEPKRDVNMMSELTLGNHLEGLKTELKTTKSKQNLESIKEEVDSVRKIAKALDKRSDSEKLEMIAMDAGNESAGIKARIKRLSTGTSFSNSELQGMSAEELLAAGYVRVPGFTKADGTKVKSHIRKLR